MVWFARGSKGGELVLAKDTFSQTDRSCSADVPHVVIDPAASEWQEAYVPRGSAHEVKPLLRGDRIAIKYPVYHVPRVRTKADDGQENRPWRYKRLLSNAATLERADQASAAALAAGGTPAEARVAWDGVYGRGTAETRRTHWFCD
jgi:hypothetical protein